MLAVCQTDTMLNSRKGEQIPNALTSGCLELKWETQPHHHFEANKDYFNHMKP